VGEMRRRQQTPAWGSPGRGPGASLVDQSAERRWELTPRQVDRSGIGWASRAGLTLIAAVWAAGTAALGFLTAGAIGTPLDVGVQLDAFPEGWAAVPLATVLGVPLTFWTAGGVGLAQQFRRGHLTSVVTTGPRGVRAVAHRRRGDDVVVERTWDELDGVVIEDHRVMVTGRRGKALLVSGGTEEQRSEIVATVTSHLTGAGRLPVLSDWRTYIGDDGPTMATERGERRERAWLFGVAAVLAWANGGALVVGMTESPLWIWLAVPCLAAAGSLTTASYGYARWTPRWTARPGAVVLLNRPGGEVAFEARSLEHLETVDSDGTHWHRLFAVSMGEGDAADRLKIFGFSASSHDAQAAGVWLAHAAEIPFRYRFSPYEPP
jgi:hypothetical protein